MPFSNLVGPVRLPQHLQKEAAGGGVNAQKVSLLFIPFHSSAGGQLELPGDVWPHLLVASVSFPVSVLVLGLHVCVRENECACGSRCT